jgi:hypothetical protein
MSESGVFSRGGEEISVPRQGVSNAFRDLEPSKKRMGVGFSDLLRPRKVIKMNAQKRRCQAEGGVYVSC